MSEEKKFETEELGSFTANRKKDAKEGAPFVTSVEKALKGTGIEVPESSQGAYLAVFHNTGAGENGDYDFLSAIVSKGTGDEREELAKFTLSRRKGASEKAPYQAPASAMGVESDAWLKAWIANGSNGEFLSVKVERSVPAASNENDAAPAQEAQNDPFAAPKP